jgi:hypothetical protein
MRRSRYLLAAIVVAALAAPSSAWGVDRLDTGIQNPLDGYLGETDPESVFTVAHGLGASVARYPVNWSQVARNEPADPENPRDPAYDWAQLDQVIAQIERGGLKPLLVLYSAPEWARVELGDGRQLHVPRTEAFADFTTAIAGRYDGRAGRPRVRYFQIWNEPNLSLFFSLRRGAQRYRKLVNAAARRIHTAAWGNVVVAGGLSPFAEPPGQAISPLAFMRRVLCMTGRRDPRPSCAATSSFDVWAHHPYTSGGPSHSANRPDDVSLGDLALMHRLLRAAERAGHVRARGRARLWVTEFSWETKPPDPYGVPLRRHARWVAEAMYRMWRDGVSLVVWFQLRDSVVDWAPFGEAGLFFKTTERYADERAKPTARAFAFPFVAVPENGRVTLWGRTPDSRRHLVAIERRSDGRWTLLARVRANSHGIFRARRANLAGAVVRARVGGSASLPYKAAPTRDRPVNPFGDQPVPR